MDGYVMFFKLRRGKENYVTGTDKSLKFIYDELTKNKEIQFSFKDGDVPSWYNNIPAILKY